MAPTPIEVRSSQPESQDYSGDKVTVGHTSWGLGEGEDAQVETGSRQPVFPSDAPWWKEELLRRGFDEARQLRSEIDSGSRSVDSLIGILRQELRDNSGGAPAETMVDNFATRNARSPLVWPPGSELSDLVSRSGAFATPRYNARVRIHAVIHRQVTEGGYIDYRELADCVPSSLLPCPSYPITSFFGVESQLKGPLGGTQAIWGYVRNFRVDTRHNLATMTLGFNVADDFGVSDDDVYSRGLAAFWLLQHNHGYAPFKNYVYVEEEYTLRYHFRFGA
jgi:hypothetical protein